MKCLECVQKKDPSRRDGMILTQIESLHACGTPPHLRDLAARSLNAYGRQYVSGSENHTVPTGRAPFFDAFQALPAWLLSFCPYGTARSGAVFPGNELPGLRRAQSS